MKAKFTKAAVLVAGIGLSVSAMGAPKPVSAEQRAGVTEAALRINIAGRQRMLTQRMSKAACLAVSGVDAEAQAEIAHAAADEFEQNLAFLRFGDDRAAGETSEDVLDVLSGVAELAPPLTASTRQLASGDLHSIVMSIMISSNLPILARSDEVVAKITQAALPEGYAATVNVAGRQRMLSQRIAKSLCFIGMDLSADASREELRVAVKLFDETLSLLVEGAPDENLKAPPTPEIAKQFDRVEEAWMAVRADVQQVIDDKAIQVKNLKPLTDGLDVVLQEMDRTVSLWTEYVEASS